MRLVLDTNVVVSATLWGGMPARLLESAVQDQVIFFTCPELIAELLQVLSRPKFLSRLSAINSTPEILAQWYRDATTSVQLPSNVPHISRDPNDDVVLACAAEAAVDAVISGDGDLLVLGHHRNIAILTVSQVLSVLQL